MRWLKGELKQMLFVSLVVLAASLLVFGAVPASASNAEENNLEGKVDILVYDSEEEEYRKEGDEIHRYMAGDSENITFSYRKTEISDNYSATWNFELSFTLNRTDYEGYLKETTLDDELKDAFDDEAGIELSDEAEFEWVEEDEFGRIIDHELDREFQIELTEDDLEISEEKPSIDQRLGIQLFSLDEERYEEEFDEIFEDKHHIHIEDDLGDDLKEDLERGFEEWNITLDRDARMVEDDDEYWILEDRVRKYRIEKDHLNVTKEGFTYEFKHPVDYHLTLDLDVENEEDNRTYRDELLIEIERDERGTFLTAIGAGLAVGIAGMGAGIGVGIAGAAGAGTIAEKPDKFGKCLVFQALPQTQAIYGLLIAVLLLLFTGVIGGEGFVPLNVGIASLGVGLAVGIAGLSAIGQGIAASGSIASYSENEELFGKGMVFSVLPETQAIYGLLVGILIMVFTGLLGAEILPELLGEKGMGLALITIGGGLAVGVAGLSGIGQGIASGAGIGSVAENEELFGKGMVFSVLPETQAIYGLLIAILLMVFSGLLGGDIIDAMAGTSGFSLGLIGIGAGLAVGIAGLSGIGQGIAAASGIGSVAENEDVFGRGMVFSVLPETQAIYGMLIAILLMIFSGLLGEAALVGESAEIQMFLGLVGIGAGLAVGIAGLSGIGQGIAAGSGIATVAEDEGMFGRGMVFSVLPETQAIYGMLISILLMVFSGLLGDVYPEGAGVPMGIAAVGAGLAIGIAGVSGVGQGITSGSAIAAVSKREETFGKGMIFSVMSETFAIFGLLIAIFIIVFLGFM